MPTGYTANVGDGTLTSFNDFALQCAKAFGACISLRDEPSSTAIPDEFEPSTYSANRLVECKEQLAVLRGMTIDQKQAAADKHNAEALASFNKYEANKQLTRKRYEAMTAHVEGWNPPTPEHVGLRDFMLEQLTKSIDFDCTNYLTRPTPLGRDAWYLETVDKAERDIAYHSKENEKEIERTRQRTEWVKALRASLSTLST